MPKITATTRLFRRTRSTTDLDGWLVWEFPEVPPAPALGAFLSREWTVRESPSGVRHSTLKIRDERGLHSRALTRIEEDHLMKFAIRD